MDGKDDMSETSDDEEKIMKGGLFRHYYNVIKDELTTSGFRIRVIARLDMVSTFFVQIIDFNPNFKRLLTCEIRILYILHVQRKLVGNIAVVAYLYIYVSVSHCSSSVYRNPSCVY